jgi:transcriptional regulator with XRE-family HTH domain
VILFTKLCIMAKNAVIMLPRLQQLLTQAGEDIRLARLRRKLSTTRVAERAAISRNTLHAIEQGTPTVSLGAYLQILFVLGLEKTILNLAAGDALGRKLQDTELTVSTRAPKQSSSE